MAIEVLHIVPWQDHPDVMIDRKKSVAMLAFDLLAVSAQPFDHLPFVPWHQQAPIVPESKDHVRTSNLLSQVLMTGLSASR